MMQSVNVSYLQQQYFANSRGTGLVRRVLQSENNSSHPYNIILINLYLDRVVSLLL